MNVDDPRLAVPNAAEDKALRARASIVILAFVVIAGFLSRQVLVAGMPGPLLAAGALAGAFFVAWRVGVLGRAFAMLMLGSIRARGLEATQKLNAGDIAGARVLFEALTTDARRLGGFHSVHVLMLGVVSFFEGDTKTGLVLASRAIASGWFSARETREVLHAAETWRVLMLLHAGELKQARVIVERAPKAVPTAELVLLAYEEKWTEAVTRATELLAQEDFPGQGRPTVALIGLYAAKRLSNTSAGEPPGALDTAGFEKVLTAEPPQALALQNPALRRFLA